MVPGVIQRLSELIAGVLFIAAFVETWHNRTATNPPVAGRVA
jgi:hypothetical protein